MVDVAADTIAIIASKVRSGQSTVQPTDNLTDLGLDSLLVMELVFDIEEKFDITIPFNANDVSAGVRHRCRSGLVWSSASVDGKA